MAARHRAQPAPTQVTPDTPTEALTQTLDRYWDRSADDVLQALGSSRDGLDRTRAEASVPARQPSRQAG